MTEYEINTSSRHTITSDVTLNCAETGRVVAVFYNDYDAEALLAAAPQQAAEPVAYGLLNRSNRKWDGETLITGADAEGYDADALLPLYAGHPPAQPAPIPTSIDMDRMMYAYKLLPDDVKQKLSLNMLAELRKALNLTFIPTPDTGLSRPAAPDGGE